jgi:hypothetical protein
MLTGFCTGTFGTSNGSCSTTGNDSTCQSGFCVNDTGGSNRRCLTLCTSSCSGLVGDACTAVGSPTTIEGIPTTGKKYCYDD